MTQTIATAMIGLGNVNRNFLKILEMKADQLRTQYGLAFRIVCVADSSGVAVNAAGFDPAQLRQFKEAGGRVHQRKEFLPNRTAVEVLTDLPCDLVLEASPVNLKTGEPGLDVTRVALQRGISVVLANKGPLVLAFRELHDRLPNGREFNTLKAAVGLYGLHATIEALKQTAGKGPGAVDGLLAMLAEQHDAALAVARGSIDRDARLRVLIQLYESEINCGIESFWDAGFRVWLGLPDNPVAMMETKLDSSVDDLEQAFETHVEQPVPPARATGREIDEQRAPLHQVEWHGAPEAAVVRVVTIVAHHEQFTRWHGRR